MWPIERLDDTHDVLTSFLCCTVVYEALHRLAHQTPKFSSQSLALLHCIYVSLATTYWCYHTEDQQLQRNILTLTLGYFLWDLTFCTITPTVGWDMWFHALFCTFGMYYALIPVMADAATRLLLFKWTSPFLYGFKMIQPRTKWTFRLWFLLTSCFFLSFTGIRMVWGTYYIVGQALPEAYNTLTSTDRVVTCGILLSALGLNFVWYYKILFLLYQKLRKSKDQ